MHGIVGKLYYVVVATGVTKLDSDDSLLLTDTNTIVSCTEDMGDVYKCGYWDIGTGSSEKVGFVLESVLFCFVFVNVMMPAGSWCSSPMLVCFHHTFKQQSYSTKHMYRYIKIYIYNNNHNTDTGSCSRFKFNVRRTLFDG
jgi:hypothetical protein